jgi:hypothetical protein
VCHWLCQCVSSYATGHGDNVTLGARARIALFYLNVCRVEPQTRGVDAWKMRWQPVAPGGIPHYRILQMK